MFLLETSDLHTLRSLTDKLLAYNKQAAEQFSKTKSEKDYTADFYNEVKPFADEVQNIALKWKKLTLQWLSKKNIKYLYPQQIEAAYENLLIVSIKAFQKDTRPKRFHEMIKSIDFVLNAIITRLK